MQLQNGLSGHIQSMSYHFRLSLASKFCSSFESEPPRHAYSGYVVHKMTIGYSKVDTLFELITCVCVCLCVCACVNIRPSIQNQDLDAEVTLLRTRSRDCLMNSSGLSVFHMLDSFVDRFTLDSCIGQALLAWM